MQTSGVWQVKRGRTVANVTTINYTIPTSCWGDTIQLKMFVNNYVPTSGIGYCHNSTGWEVIYDDGYHTIYEEAMWWDTKLFDISTCTDLNITGATYLLDSDIINHSSSVCMDITKSDITLDCQGHTIQGNNSGSEYGVYSQGDGIDNVVVKNCNISGWYGGIYAYGSLGSANIGLLPIIQ